MRKTKRYTRMLSSIRFRIVLVYVLLIFIAMTLLGIFIVRQLESYHMQTVRDNFDKMAGNMLDSLNNYGDINENQPEIQGLVEQWGWGIKEDIFIINDQFMIVASRDGYGIGQNAVDILNENVIVRALDGVSSEEDGYLAVQEIPVMNKAYPIGMQDHYTGALYLRADIKSIYDTVNNTKAFFIQAMIISILATGILGFVIAGSITVPVNVLRRKAEDMARGDFAQVVEVKSDDEIGRLTEMFNIMQKRLGASMSAMLNEKNKLETILKYMADGLIAVDMEGNIIHANDMAIEMLRLDRNKLSYMSYYDVMMQKCCKELMLKSIKSNSEETDGDVVFEYKSSIFYARYGKFKDEAKRDVGFIIVIQDITRQRKLENMQMDFVANVSHELKTPLTTIKSYIETILETLIEGERITDNQTLKHFLSVVDKEAERMSRLVKDLLQLSRLDYKKEVLNLKKWDMTAIVEDAMIHIEINAQNKDQHLNAIFDVEREIFAQVDRDRITQVLINILSNAIKYTAEKGRIDVDIRETSDVVTVVVADNGIGIPSGDIPRLFERFYRVDKARSRQMGGTGLGLAIAKQLIEAHGGSITVDSKEGRGTTVAVLLPKNGTN